MKLALATLALATTLAVPAQQAPAHTVTTFNLTVALPYAEAAKLFGPEGERVWATDGWNPHFLYPQPAHDTEGAVFTTTHGPHTVVWVNTLFDLNARHFQYVHILPEVQAVTIDVRFTPTDAHHTAVAITYTRTALSTDFNDMVTRDAKNDATSGPDWQHQIETYLSSQSK